MTETEETRRKRLRIRAWRRGIKEMDLVLGGYADAELAGMDHAAMDRLEALMAESDHDLWAWVSGAEAPPEGHAALVSELSARRPAAER